MEPNLKFFNLLDKWRHFPNYQLERRVDIFFALYMREILGVRGIRNISTVIPEFPVRIGEITKYTAINRSYKIDYLVIYSSNRVAYIELKTDRNSRRVKQDQYLLASKKVGFIALLNGLLKIYSATNSKNKYQALLEELVASEVIVKSSDNKYSVVEQSYDEEIIYIQPIQTNLDEAVITFHEIAKKLAKKDRTAQRFAKSLIEWAEVESGHIK